MVSNFSENFIEFVNRVEQALPKQFVPVRMTEHNGRVAALTAEYSISEKRKLMGIMPTGSTSHCHEFRLLYAVPTMDLAALEDWWEFARGVQREIVPVDPLHEFSMVSLILVSGEVDKAVIRKLKGKASELRYDKPNAGWSSVRIALVDLESRKIHVNRMGAPLRDLIKDLV
ncbi:MAG: hypothetical protein ACI3XZ_00050 [Butyricicoccus sp.]